MCRPWSDAALCSSDLGPYCLLKAACTHIVGTKTFDEIELP